LNKFKKIVVCELNSGQFASHLRSKLKLKGEILQYNKVQGQPFTVEELLRHFSTIL
jgi:2-oxoglutarate ferredoxin oxidoreductase subunit alpha